MDHASLQNAVHLDERAPSASRLLVAGLALAADLPIEREYVRGAVQYLIKTATRGPQRSNS